MNRYEFLKPLPKKAKKKSAKKSAKKKVKKNPRETASQRLRRLLNHSRRVALTGVGPRTRSDLVEMLQEMGHTYTTSVTSADILVSDNGNNRITGKIRDARRRRIPIVSYDDFFRNMTNVSNRNWI